MFHNKLKIYILLFRYSLFLTNFFKIMTKGVKRNCKIKLTNGPQAKLPKLFDYKNLTKDISGIINFIKYYNDFVI